MKLSIGLATRKRPAMLLETLERTLPNITNPETTIRVLVDVDDAPTITAINTSPLKGNPHVIVDIRQREDTVGQKYNRIMEFPADVYSAMVDHTHHVTPGFDDIILDAAAWFPDEIGVVFNHLANASFAGCYALTAKFAEMQGGYIFPPYFPYWFIDHWLDDVAKLIGRVSFADVRTDSTRKPAVTQEMREPHWWATFYDACAVVRRQIANDIVWSKDFHEPLWRKRILEKHYPLVEFHSFCINSSVRQSAQALQGIQNLSTNDVRYQNVKARAIAMLPDIFAQMPASEVLWYRNILTPPTKVANMLKTG